MFGKYVFKGFMWALCIATGFMVYAFSDTAGEDISNVINTGDVSQLNQKDLVDPDTYFKGITDIFNNDSSVKDFGDKQESVGRFGK